MKVEFVWPKWCELPWTEILPSIFREHHEVTVSNCPTFSGNVVVYGWADDATRKYVSECPVHIKQVVFIRSYDFYLGVWQVIEWDKVDLIYFVNNVYAIEFNRQFNNKYADKVRVVYNAVDFDKWSYREHKHGNNIALVGLINHKKNIPLSLQIVSKLKKNCTLHLIGNVQDIPTYAYLVYLAKQLKIKVIAYGGLPQPALNKILDGMDYLLCCSIVEGNPNNVNEAMAKGIKPIIHSWPGSVQQYGPGLLFSSVDEAVHMLSDQSPYVSKQYRQIAEERFSLKNLYGVRNEIEKL